jgi:hypothetical protein
MNKCISLPFDSLAEALSLAMKLQLQQFYCGALQTAANLGYVFHSVVLFCGAPHKLVPHSEGWALLAFLSVFSQAAQKQLQE